MAYGNVGVQSVITIQPQSLALGKIVTATSFQQGCIWWSSSPWEGGGEEGRNQSILQPSNENNIAKSMSILKLCRIYLLNETLLVVVILTVSKWYRGEDRLSGKLHDFHVLRLSAEVGKASCLFFSLP